MSPAAVKARHRTQRRGAAPNASECEAVRWHRHVCMCGVAVPGEMGSLPSGCSKYRMLVTYSVNRAHVRPQEALHRSGTCEAAKACMRQHGVGCCVGRPWGSAGGAHRLLAAFASELDHRGLGPHRLGRVGLGIHLQRAQVGARVPHSRAVRAARCQGYHTLLGATVGW